MYELHIDISRDLKKYLVVAKVPEHVFKEALSLLMYIELDGALKLQ